MELPVFRYHPDPIRTESVKVSDQICVVCEQRRGYIYTSHVYSTNECWGCICPWCIADGTAHQKLGVTFFDETAVGGYVWEGVSDTIVNEIAQRTPGFSGWQQEMWFTHCQDAAAFLGAVGYQELRTLGREAIDAIRVSTGLEAEDPHWTEFFQALNKDGAPTAYLFECIHCGTYGGYTNTD